MACYLYIYFIKLYVGLNLVIGGLSHEKSKVSRELVLTDEWQVVGPDQTVPRGVHVSLNLETGERLAKKLDTDKGTNERNDKHALITTSPIIEHDIVWNQEGKKGVDISPIDAMTANESLPLLETNMSRFEELKSIFANQDFMIMSDMHRINKLLKNYEKILQISKDPKVRQAEAFTFLDQMTPMLHQVDNAQKFADMDGFRFLNQMLQSDNKTLIHKAAIATGNAVQNNKPVQVDAFRAGLMPTLIDVMALPAQGSDITANNIMERPDHESSPTDSKKAALYALSCMLRNFPEAQITYFEAYRGIYLLKAFVLQNIQSSNETYVQKLITKAITLIDDLLVERESFLNYSEPGDKSYQENLDNYERLDLLPKLRQANWCEVFGSILPRLSDLDSIEKIVRSWRNLMPVCQEEFKRLIPALDQISETMEDPDADIEYVTLLSGLIDISVEMAKSGNTSLPTF